MHDCSHTLELHKGCNMRRQPQENPSIYGMKLSMQSKLTTQIYYISCKNNSWVLFKMNPKSQKPEQNQKKVRQMETNLGMFGSNIRAITRRNLVNNMVEIIFLPLWAARLGTAFHYSLNFSLPAYQINNLCIWL